MRILLSAYACRPNAGSEPGVGWNWATHLSARGIEVHVLVAQRNQESIEAGLRARPISNLHFNYVRVPYEWAKHNEALHYVCWQMAALKAARDLAKKIDFQLIHHVTYASIHVPSQLWRLGIPVVFGPVGGGQTTPAKMLSYFSKDKPKELLRSSLTYGLKLSPVHARWLRQMSFILAANNDTLKIVQNLRCENASLMCDTAIPSDYFADAPPNTKEWSKSLRLLWVGRMLARKALPLALDSLKKVKGNVSLTIAGDGLPSDTVRQMIRERNLQHRVFWKGCRLNYEELRKAYQTHDAMLFTSLRDSFGSQVLEAMAMGLPIIALDLHGVHDWVPEGAAFKVAVGDTQDTVRNLANAIEKYASLPASRRNEMATHAWSFAKTQSWPERAALCERLYQNIVSKTATCRSVFPLHGTEAKA
jgi:glycosyltransferase involved in cell wall biosynthesis